MTKQKGSVNWNDYYTPDEAAAQLTRNSGKEVPKDYLRTLIRYGVFNPQKLGNINMYLRSEVDAYKVEGRGGKLEHKRARKAAEAS